MHTHILQEKMDTLFLGVFNVVFCRVLWILGEKATNIIELPKKEYHLSEKDSFGGIKLDEYEDHNYSNPGCFSGLLRQSTKQVCR